LNIYLCFTNVIQVVNRMNKAGIVIIATLVLCACDNEAERLAHHEQVCQKALDLGLLEHADKECTSALGTSGSASLDPATRSERLLRLASIKRQQNLYAEAEKLILQTLLIEQGVPNPDTFAVARRHQELSMALAGQRKWREGAIVLESLLPEVANFSAAEQKAITNMIKLYVNKLKNSDQAHLTKLLDGYLQQPKHQPSSEKSHSD